jgi:hypothetical protein
VALVCGVLAFLLAVALVNSARSEHDAVVVGPDAVAQLAPTPSVQALGCPSWPGFVITREATALVGATADPHRAVVSWRCVDATGRRHPSLVQIVESTPGSGTGRVSAVLVRPSQNLHVDRVTASHAVIRIVASYWSINGPGCCSAAPRQGTVSLLTYATRDGVSYSYASSQHLADACAGIDLDVSIEKAVVAVGEAALLRFVNHGSVPCAIEGYPSVIATSGSSYPRAASPSLSGPDGGVSDETVAPIVLLRPHEVATAVIESLSAFDAGADCPRSISLTVSLPAAGPVAQLPFAIRLCNPEVHPVVPGATGRG